MGEVYEAQDSSLNGLRVALKTIRPEIAPEKHAYERFKREVWVARELTHDGICRIFDLVEHVDTSEDGVQRVVPCLTMQLLDGKTLAAVIAAKRPLTIDESLPLIRQMVEALQAMHDKGIVHRDIKPSNIMLVECGSAPARVVVMDFGLAKPVQQRSLLWESRGVERAGAPYFIAPEILRGEKGQQSGLSERVDRRALLEETAYGSNCAIRANPAVAGGLGTDHYELPGSPSGSTSAECDRSAAFIGGRVDPCDPTASFD
jgi:serine/threonine protein kinase